MKKYSNYLEIFFLTESCMDDFVCESGAGIVCIYQHQVCDSFRHCIDESDEQHCGMCDNYFIFLMHFCDKILF